jgi:hypothetical protein
METLIDDDVYDEMKRLVKKWVYTPFKNMEEKQNKKEFDIHSIINKQGMLLAFHHAWLDPLFVSEKSKQREYLAKAMINKLNEKWSQDVIDYENKNNTTMFTDAVLDLKDKVVSHGKYKKLAALINERDYKKEKENTHIFDSCIWCDGNSLNEEICDECLTRN